MRVPVEMPRLGYDSEVGSGRIAALLRGKESVQELRAGEEGQVRRCPT